MHPPQEQECNRGASYSPALGRHAQRCQQEMHMRHIVSGRLTGALTEPTAGTEEMSHSHLPSFYQEKDASIRATDKKSALQGCSSLATREVSHSGNSRRLEVDTGGELADTRIVHLRQQAGGRSYRSEISRPQRCAWSAEVRRIQDVVELRREFRSSYLHESGTA